MFVHLLVSGHLDSFKSLVIMNNASMNTGIQNSIGAYVLISLAWIFGKELQKHMVDLTFLRNFQTVFKNGYISTTYIYLPISNT